MKKALFLSVIILLSISLNAWAQGNHYFIKVKLSEDMKQASGVQRIEFVNPNDYPLEKLYFRVNYSDDKPLCQIKEITEIDGAELAFGPSIEYPKVIEVKLKQHIKSNEKLSLIIHFTSPVSYYYNFIFGYLGGYWHPKAVPYYQGKLQPLNREIAYYEVEVELPAEKTVATSGEIINQKKSKKGLKKIFTRARDITNYGLIFFNDIEKKEIIADGVKITTYYSSKLANWTKELDEVAADAVKFYIKEIGFYPQRIINIIPGSIKYATGGFPIASNVFAIHNLEGTGEGYGRRITAHEIAHYYWGFDYVLTPGEYCDWLGIALGMYTNRLYGELRFPNRRRNRYYYSYLTGALLGYDTTIMQKMEELAKANFNWNNILMHSKAFTVIKMLEYVVGQETFRKIYNTLISRYKHKVLTAEEFQKVCHEISGQDLRWFFQHWLYSNDKLDYIISQVKTYKKEDKFLTRVEVKKIGQIGMPIDVALTTIDGNKYSKIFPRQLDIGWVEFLTPSGLKDVKLDPSEKMPLISRINDEIKEYMIYDCYYQNRYVKSLNLIYEVLASNPKNADMLYYQGRAYRKLGKFEKALQSLQKVVDLKEEDEGARNLSPWCHIRRGYIFDLQDRRQLAINEYKKALNFPDYRGAHIEAKKRLDQPFVEEDEK